MGKTKLTMIESDIQ